MRENAGPRRLGNSQRLRSARETTYRKRTFPSPSRRPFSPLALPPAPATLTQPTPSPHPTFDPTASDRHPSVCRLVRPSIRACACPWHRRHPSSPAPPPSATCLGHLNTSRDASRDAGGGDSRGHAGPICARGRAAALGQIVLKHSMNEGIAARFADDDRPQDHARLPQPQHG